MNIPESIIRPFGYVGMPVVDHEMRFRDPSTFYKIMTVYFVGHLAGTHSSWVESQLIAAAKSLQATDVRCRAGEVPNYIRQLNPNVIEPAYRLSCRLKGSDRRNHFWFYR